MLPQLGRLRLIVFPGSFFVGFLGESLLGETGPCSSVADPLTAVAGVWILSAMSRSELPLQKGIAGTYSPP